jgi:hypothetical protein
MRILIKCADVKCAYWSSAQTRGQMRIPVKCADARADVRAMCDVGWRHKFADDSNSTSPSGRAGVGGPAVGIHGVGGFHVCHGGTCHGGSFCQRPDRAVGLIVLLRNGEMRGSEQTIGLF